MKLALFLSAILLGALAKAPDTEADRLWALMLQAKGGRAKLETIHSVVLATTVAFPNFTAADVAPREQSTLVVEFPDRFWSFTDNRPGKMGFTAVVWNGPSSHVWAWSDGQRSLDQHVRNPKVYGDTAERLQLMYLLHTRWVDPKPVSVSTTRGHLVLHATWNDVSLTYRVDEATKLPASLDMRREIPNLRQPDKPMVRNEHFEFDGYLDVGGIKLPGRVKFGGDWGRAEYQINPDLDPHLFDQPIDPILSAEAWRKFLRAHSRSGSEK